MNPDPKKLQQQQRHQEEAALTHQAAHRQTGLEFASVEEAFRHDAAQVQVPASVEKRLIRSLDRESVSDSSWWRKLFGS